MKSKSHKYTKNKYNPLSNRIITILLLFLSVQVFAQDMERRVERIKALRVAFISDRLDLSPQEAQQFWPVFNQFEEKQFELLQQKRQLAQRMKTVSNSSLSEKETVKLMDEDDQLENEIQSNKRQLVKDLQGVIPNQKILMLKQIEIEFKNKLLQQMKNKRGRFKN